MSSLYLYGRKEDLAFEKPVGHSPRERHHVRLWKAPETKHDRPLWMGSATHDIGVELSHTTGQVTHHIAPDVDAERDLLLAELTDTKRVLGVRWVMAIRQCARAATGEGTRGTPTAGFPRSPWRNPPLDPPPFPVTLRPMKLLRFLAFLLLFLVCIPVFAWTFGALYYDGPSKGLAWGLAAAVLLAAVFVRKWWRKLGVVAAWFGIVLAWWLTLKPSNDGDWQADVAQKPWAEVNGDEVTIHNVRNCVYRTDTDYTAVWETRKVRLSQLTHIDLFINFWGSPWMAHPIVSFQFADAPPLCFSIETRKKVGQTLLGGRWSLSTIRFDRHRRRRAGRGPRPDELSEG